jgi:MoxR-like ATPase
MPDELLRYIVRIVRATRPQIKDQFGKVKNDKGVDYAKLVNVGASVRAQQNIAVSSAAVAFLNNRDKVTPDDVKFVARDILRARIGKSEMAHGRFNADDFINSVLNSVEIIGK